MVVRETTHIIHNNSVLKVAYEVKLNKYKIHVNLILILSESQITIDWF